MLHMYALSYLYYIYILYIYYIYIHTFFRKSLIFQFAIFSNFHDFTVEKYFNFIVLLEKSPGINERRFSHICLKTFTQNYF